MRRTWWRPAPAIKAAERASRRGVEAGAEKLLDLANETVPRESGDLADSGRVTVEDDVAFVSYGTPYAVRQHETPGLNYRGRGRHKWLEHTAKERPREVGGKLAEGARKGWK